jgi:hypothetical protein
MIEENQELNLEADRLEELMESPPPGQPVVVIQYRSRGVPWYLVLPLLVLVPIGAVAVYHRVSGHAGYLSMPPRADRSTRKAADAQAATEPPSNLSASTAGQQPRPAAIAGFGSPLSLNSQPIAPGSVASLLPPPAASNDQAKPGSPAADSAATKEAEPSKPAPATQLADAASDTTAAAALPPAVTPPKQPGFPVAPDPAGDATRPAFRPPVTVGFSVPADNDNPFAELAISRGRPGSTTAQNQERAAASESPVAASDPPPGRRPEPTQEQLFADIQAEASERAAELQQRRHIKDRARAVIDSETQARAEDERAAFRRDLQEAIKLSRREAASQIEDLCNRYGRNYSDELRSKGTYLLSRFGGKMSREAKVRMLRLYGIPEPGILDFLAQDIHRLINSRGGPRDSSEVRVDAARQLLHIDLGKDGGGASKGVSAPRVRPAGSAAANSAPGNNQVRWPQ